MNELSERRLAENELLFRHNNTKHKNRYQREHPGGGKDLLINFYCECSDRSCHERIFLTAEAYEKLHQSNKQFIAMPGHENPSIEEVVKPEGLFNVIQKYKDPDQLAREPY